MNSSSVSGILIIMGLVSWSVAVLDWWLAPGSRRLTRKILFRLKISRETPSEKAFSTIQLLGEFWVLIGILLSLIAPFENVSEETIAVRFAVTFLLPLALVTILLNRK